MRSINVSGVGNNCGLYAVGLGLKRAVQKGVEMEGRAAPLRRVVNELNRYTEADFKGSGPRTVALGRWLREELALAFRSNPDFKEQQKAAFVGAIERMRNDQGPSGDIHPELLAKYFEEYELWRRYPTETLKSFWDEKLFEEYVNDMATRSLFISDEELKCLATYWGINLSISQAGQESDLFEMEFSDNGINSDIGCCIWNPGEGSGRMHWQSIDFDAAPDHRYQEDEEKERRKNNRRPTPTQEKVAETVSSSIATSLSDFISSIVNMIYDFLKGISDFCLSWITPVEAKEPQEPHREVGEQERRFHSAATSMSFRDSCPPSSFSLGERASEDATDERTEHHRRVPR